MSAEPISYTLSFTDREHHYVDVKADVPCRDAPAVELMMAVWTPGSYLVREYSRHVEGVRATTPEGSPLDVRKSRKNRWRITSGGASKIVVTYRVYCRDMSVRGNWVDEEFALLNGAPTFLTLQEEGPRPHEVCYELPSGWGRCLSPLPADPQRGECHFRAPDYDTLVDSPCVAGNPAVHEFEVGGRKHYLVNQGGEGIWDGARSAADVEKLVEEQQRMWQVVPYERYFFFNVISEAGGGLEHRNSTVIMTSRWSYRRRKAYLDWLGLVSHEFFHTWNVKRLRPLELGPFDYEEEVYTRSLWIVEGITNYYTDLVVLRAGLSTEEEYLGKLSRLVRRLQTTPGRLLQSLEESSFDAWIKLYRQDENTVNSTVSYYVKGAVVAFLLDARIRRCTNGDRCLDDVLRRAYHRFAGERGFRPDEFQEIVQEVAGTDLNSWLRQALGSVEELDYGEALERFGLRFKDASEKSPAEEAEGRGDDRKAWLGLRASRENGRLVVTQVPRDTPAHRSGIQVGDEIIALDDFRIPPNDWDKRLEQHLPGDQIELLLARRERILARQVTLGEDPGDPWRLEIDAEATEEQNLERENWYRRPIAR